MRQHQETLRWLLTRMGCHWVAACSLEEGIRILRRGPTAAAVLDSGIAGPGSHEKNDKIQDMVKCLADRAILVFGETPEPHVMEVVP